MPISWFGWLATSLLRALAKMLQVSFFVRLPCRDVPGTNDRESDSNANRRGTPEGSERRELHCMDWLGIVQTTLL